MRDDRERLLDILDAAERVSQIAAAGREAYDASDVVQDALIRRIEVIGEAAGRLSEELRSSHRDVPWRQAAAMRNRTAHGYFDVDPDLVWEVACRDVPALVQDVQRIVDELPEGPTSPTQP